MGAVREPVEVGDRVILTDPALTYHCSDCGTGHMRGTVIRRKERLDYAGRVTEVLLKLKLETDPEHAGEHRFYVPEWGVLKSEKSEGRRV